MLRVVKLGGLVVLKYRNNEAEKEQYRGFHQWNFDLREGEFSIWNQSGMMRLSDFVTIDFKVDCLLEDGWIRVAIYKLSDFLHFAEDPRFRTRIAEITRAMIDLFIDMQVPELSVSKRQ